MPESIDTSLVRIRTRAGRVVGAGFLVGTRYILTCAHVIEQTLDLADDALDPTSFKVSLDFPKLASQRLFSAKVIFWLPEQENGQGDVAGLELLDEPPDGAQAAHFAPADQVWDHPFRALGFPQGYDDGVWATGRLLGRQGRNWLQIEDVVVPGFAIIEGFSGSPVWDTQSQGIVGMIVAASRETGTKTAFVIPSDILRGAWPQLADIMTIRPPVPRNPYKGLHAFTEHDARDFFGREALIDELVTAIETALTHNTGELKKGQQSRLLTVVLGSSGSGKSSTVMAGLLPWLRDRGVLNSKEWVYLDPIFPGAHPLEAIAISLAKHLPARGSVSIHDDLASASTRSLHLLVSQLTSSPQQKVVLLVDQFEEVFILTTDEAERRHFFELLVTAVTEPRGPLFVIFTLRADFYDRPMQYPDLYQLIDDHHISVLPLKVDDLRKVIEEPAKLPDVQLTFDNGLIDELLLDMQGQSGSLPLLEFTLDQLFQRRSGYQLTLQAYHEMGGVKGALSKHAEETYQALPSDEHRQMAHDIFLRLIEPGTTDQDTTRRRADRSEFERTNPIQTQQVRETLETFISARLLTTNQIGGKTTVEVSHEALIREWKRLTEWLHEARDDIRFQRSLSENVVEWEQRNRPGDRLYRGAQLKEARAWARRNRPSEQETTFLKASLTQRILSLVGIIVVVLLLISSMGLAGWYVFFQPSKTLVTTLLDSGTTAGSLRWCIDNAPSGSIIRFAHGLRGTIELTGGDLVFASNKSLTIIGPGANQLTISNGNNNAKIHVFKHAILTISGMIFKNSETRYDAFLINEGTLTMTSSIISDNKTTASGGIGYSFGGAIENKDTGTLMVTDSTLSDNMASGWQGSQGGSIYNEGKLSVTGSTFSNNTASGSNDLSLGGGIFNVNGGTLSVTASTFSNNTASSTDSSGQGGGIDNEGKLSVTQSTFSKNSANSSGASAFGGGIFNYNTGILTVTNSTFSANTASGKKGDGGGGIDNEGKLSVTQSTFSKNSASGIDSLGGGIFSFGKGSSTIIRFSTIYGNTSYLGGGILVDPTSNSQMTMSSSIIAGNNAPYGPDIVGALTSDGYNLIGNVAEAKGLNLSTDRQITLDKLKIDPSLSNQGGPTQALALLTGSRAIDVVPQHACNITITDAFGHQVTITTDQSGHPRPDGSENTCDVGAYESSY